MARLHRRLSILGTGLIVLALAGQAGAEQRLELLEWEYPDAPVIQGFNVHFGSVSGEYDQQVDAKLPARNGSALYEFALPVPADEILYIVVSAYDAQGRRSPFSNPIVRYPEGYTPSPPPGPEPEPEPEPTPTLTAPGQPFPVTPAP